jgi:hypothetical protein
MDVRIRFVIREEIERFSHPVWTQAGDTDIHTHGGGTTSY